MPTSNSPATPLPNWRDLLGEIRFADLPGEEFRVMRNTDWPEYGELNSCSGCHFHSQAGRCTGPEMDDDSPCLYWADSFDVCDVIFERIGAARTRKCGRKWPKFLPD